MSTIVFYVNREDNAKALKDGIKAASKDVTFNIEEDEKGRWFELWVYGLNIDSAKRYLHAGGVERAIFWNKLSEDWSNLTR